MWWWAIRARKSATTGAPQASILNFRWHTVSSSETCRSRDTLSSKRTFAVQEFSHHFDPVTLERRSCWFATWFLAQFNCGSNLSLICNPQAMADPDTAQHALDRADRNQPSRYSERTECTEDKWVFLLKTNTNGTIERYKAGQLIKGYSQVKKIDCSETYSPVVRNATICCLLAMACKYIRWRGNIDGAARGILGLKRNHASLAD